jgi:hypothetical protein
LPIAKILDTSEFKGSERNTANSVIFLHRNGMTLRATNGREQLQQTRPIR